MKRHILALLTLIALLVPMSSIDAATITVRIQNWHADLTIFENRDGAGPVEIWLETSDYIQIAYAYAEFGPVYDADDTFLGYLDALGPGMYTEITLDIGSYSESDIAWANMNWYYTSNPGEWDEMHWTNGSSAAVGSTNGDEILRVKTDGQHYFLDTISTIWDSN
ncbi:MAG: hypothetical protein AB1813_19280 [Verrucomicrobiota bacterium]